MQSMNSRYLPEWFLTGMGKKTLGIKLAMDRNFEAPRVGAMWVRSLARAHFRENLQRRIAVLAKFILALGLTVVAACGGGGGNTPAPLSDPTAPSAISVTPGNAEDTITWGAVTGAASYNIYRSTVSGSQGTKIGASSTTSYTDSSAVNGTTYYYEVTADNAAGESAPSAQSTRATPEVPVAVPAAPTSLMAVAGNAEVTLNWAAATGATSYNIYLSTTAGSQGAKIAASSTTSYTDSSAVNGATYYYVVTANNAAGESAPSTQSTGATPKIPGTVPAAPTNLTAVAGNAQVALSWSAAVGASSYNIYRSTTAGAQGTKLGSSSTATYSDTTAANGISYSYEVTAVNAAGESPASTQSPAVTPAVPVIVPAAPTGVNATAGNGQVTVSWTAAAGATSYNIYRSTAHGTQGAKIGSSATTTYTDTTAVSGTGHYYEVTAVNAAGEGAASSQSALATPFTAISWAWIAGSKTGGASSSYGTMGVATGSTGPGARFGPTSGIDSSGNLWLFGGSPPATVSGPTPALNDLWKFDTTTSQWTWVSGSNSNNAFGHYGTAGEPTATSVPGARYLANSWVDNSGSFWLFGGSGYDSQGGSYIGLNDLWVYSPTSGLWTWVSGSNTANSAGVYGTLRTSSPSNQPGARYAASSWTDSSGNFWLFGGFGYDSQGTAGYLNDLWVFSPTMRAWTWISGSTLAGAVGQYGTLGTASAGTTPGARGGAAAWTDSAGNLLLLGGSVAPGASTSGGLNDLWKFTLRTGQWAWMGGSSSANASGSYGSVGVPSSNNVPGARGYSNAWTDSSGNMWLFGGALTTGSATSSDTTLFNDLWELNPNTFTWTWMAGSSTPTYAAGVYGTKGTTSTSNSPGARSGGSGWADGGGNLWLFGGSGIDSNGSDQELNDLWKLALSNTSLATPPSAGASGSAAVAIDTTVPAAARSLITTFVTAGGSTPATATSITVPPSVVAGEGFVLSTDGSNNVFLLGQTAPNGSITLNADSTAQALALIALDPLPPNVTLSAVTTAIQNSAEYSNLVQQVSTALAAATPPANSAAVLASLSTLASQVLGSLVPNGPTSLAGSVAKVHSTRRAASLGSPRAAAPPPLPYVLFTGDGGATAIALNDLSGNGVSLSNYSLLEWDASTQSVTGSNIADIELEPLTVWTSAASITIGGGVAATPLAGNGTQFLTIVKQNASTEQYNLLNIITNIIGGAAGEISASGESSCSVDATKALVSAELPALVTHHDSASIGNYIAGLFSPTNAAHTINTVFKCAGVSVAESAFAALFTEVSAPVKLAVTRGTVYGIKSQLALWWDQSAQVEICKSNNAIVSCNLAIQAPNTFLPVGQTETLMAVNAASQQPLPLSELTWSTTSTSATVSPSGLVTAGIVTGPALIQVTDTYADVATISLNVGLPTISPASPTAGIGQTVKLSLVDPSGNALTLTPPWQWSSNSPSIATVDPDSGLATAVAQGIATIVAQDSVSRAVTDPVQLTVSKYATTTAVVSSPTTLPPAGGTVTLTATVASAGAPTDAPAIAGTLTFTDEAGNVLCSNVPVAAATVSQCTKAVSFAANASADIITTTYSGNADYSGSSGTATVTATSVSFAGTVQGVLPLTGFTFACSPGPTCTINHVTFAVTIGQDGSIATAAANQDGNWFITDCSACSPFGTFYDWPLASAQLTRCTDTNNVSCGPTGSALIQLEYDEDSSSQDGLDYCSFSILLSPGTTGITPTAQKGSLCNYRGKGVQSTLAVPTGPPAITFTPAPSQ